MRTYGLLPLCLVFIFPTYIFGQLTYVDSISQIIATTQNDSVKGHQYVILAEHFYKRDSILSQRYIDSSKMIESYAISPLAKGMYEYIEGKWLKAQNQNTKALERFDNSLRVFEDIQNDGMIGSAEYEKGSVYLATSDYENANRSFIVCRKIAEERKDSSDLASAISALGVVQRRMGNTEGAATYYREALPIFEAIDHKQGISTCLLNIAIVEKSNKNYDEAIRLYLQAEKIAFEEKPVNNGLLAYVYGNMSSMYDDQKEYKQAYDYAIRSFDLRKKGASKTEIINSNIGLASTTLNLGRPNDALRFLNEAQRNVEDDLFQKDQINRLFAKAWNKKGNHKLAYQYLDENKSIQDSIFNLDKAKQVDKLNAEFDLERKENEINQLELATELDQVRISNQRNGLIGMGVGLGLLGFLFYRLVGQKKKIDQQNKEKDILLKEIHHRVKNNLQVISSLLGIQSRSIKDETAKEAIKEGRTRVHSMSLIHQNLYQKDNLTGIEMQDYLPKLSKNLFDTYNISGNRIKLKTDIEEMKLDVESVIPIGLIVNELITNSLKYAFPDDHVGNVFVGLKEVNDKLLLTVSDDGVGLDATQQKQKEKSFGHSLIKAFKSKLGAEIVIDGTDGTRIDMFIERYNKVD